MPQHKALVLNILNNMNNLPVSKISSYPPLGYSKNQSKKGPTREEANFWTVIPLKA